MTELPATIAEAARAVLLSAKPNDKVKAARAAGRAWRRGQIGHRFNVAMPDRPSRPFRPELLPASRMPKRGRAGSDRARIAMLHALAHIEFGAIDLAFDLAGRFGAAFPRSFVDDWIQVGADEAMHFALLDRRLRALGSHYGAMPAQTVYGKPPKKRRTTCSPGWRWCRWFWRPGGWMSRRPRLRGSRRRGTSVPLPSSGASIATKSGMSEPERNGSKVPANPAN
jgi:hypothetical protein